MTRKNPFLLFDIGNVFIFADQGITHKYLTQCYGISPKKSCQFYKIPEYYLFSAGKISETEFVRAIQTALDAPRLHAQEIRHAHDLHLTRLIQAAVSVLKKLHQHYDLGFITNTNVWQTQKEKQLIDFSIYSQIIVRSHEEHLIKPDPEIFKRTLKKIGKRHILFIDDNQSNIDVAQSLGINALKVTKNKPNLQDLCLPGFDGVTLGEK